MEYGLPARLSAPKISFRKNNVPELRYRMENYVTRSTAARPLPPPPVLPGDAYCKKDPPDASPNFDLFSQPTETEQLKSSRLTTRHTPKTCVSRPPPSAGGAYCKNSPPDAPPDFDLPPQPAETMELKAPCLLTSPRCTERLRCTERRAPKGCATPRPGPHPVSGTLKLGALI